MQLTTPLTLLLTMTNTLALASPSSRARAEPGTAVQVGAAGADMLTSVSDVTAAIAFAAQADCNLLQCAKVVASGACIVAGIASGQIEAVLACVGTGSSGICPCAGCIDALNDFLTSNGVCT